MLAALREVRSEYAKKTEEVVRRTAPNTLPTLAQLLDLGQIETSPPPTNELIEMALRVFNMLQMHI
jgi:hypothetical protein